MDWRELAKQIDDKCNFEKISQKPLNEAEKKRMALFVARIRKSKKFDS